MGSTSSSASLKESRRVAETIQHFIYSRVVTLCTLHKNFNSLKPVRYLVFFPALASIVFLVPDRNDQPVLCFVILQCPINFLPYIL